MLNYVFSSLRVSQIDFRRKKKRRNQNEKLPVFMSTAPTNKPQLAKLAKWMMRKETAHWAKQTTKRNRTSQVKKTK